MSVVTSGLRCLNTHREEHEVFLVALSDTVVHPGTVVVHLFDAAFTHTAGTHTYKIKMKITGKPGGYFEVYLSFARENQNTITC